MATKQDGGVTSSTASALRYLKSVKPEDSWAAETGPRGVRLVRRNAPLGTWFQDLALTQQKCVVGVYQNSGGPYKRAQVLVEASGVPPRWPRQVMLENTHVTTADSLDQNTANDELAILYYAIGSVVFMMGLRVFVSAYMMMCLLWLPVTYFYALQSCPSMESFNAKHQLKRVMRGEEDPDSRPRGLIGGALQRVGGGLAANLAMSTGYEVYMWNVLGACIIASVRVPSLESDCYWVGAFGRWSYMGAKEIPRTKYE